MMDKEVYFNNYYDIKKELDIRVKETNRIIEKFLPKEKGYQKIIMEAMNYSMLSGGKRLRPILIKEVSNIFNYRSPAIEYFMAAIEMIHTYSLVHDDLPAMDNDTLRRGKLSTHAKYGEAFGILAGDALLNYAFETMLCAFKVEKDYTKLIHAIDVISKKAGIYGMIGGQSVDIDEKNDISLDLILFLYEKKTASLIEASMMTGAILSGAEREEISLIEKIGHNIGIAFQIEDDILDMIGDSKKMGKSTGNDEKNNKTTYVSIEGIDKSRKKIITLTREAEEYLNKLPKRNEFIFNLFSYLINREQ